MLTAFSKHIKDVSVLRRLLFVVSQLPHDLPDLWKVALEFLLKGRKIRFVIQKPPDKTLFFELIATPSCKTLGVVLMPQMTHCLICGDTLQLRKDRTASVVIYDDSVGTIAGSHFHKICKNRSSGYTHYTLKGSTRVYANEDWECLPYFVSSRETIFSKLTMQRFETEILLGQLSFKQFAEIYNQIHKCTIFSLQSGSR